MQFDYPEQYQKTSILSDGAEIFLRPIKPTDDDMMIELFNSLSTNTVFLKFFSSLKTLTKEQLEKITHIDYKKEMAIVALVREGGAERTVAVGRYTLVDDEPGNAEFAIVVQDSHHGNGIGTEVHFHRVPSIRAGKQQVRRGFAIPFHQESAAFAARTVLERRIDAQDKRLNRKV